MNNGVGRPSGLSSGTRLKLAAWGYWTALLASVFSIGFTLTVIISAIVAPAAEWQGIEQYAAAFQTTQILPVIPPLLLAPVFVALTASVYLNVTEQKKIYGLLALCFAIIYSTIIWIIDYVELTVVRQNILHGTTDGLSLWILANPRSLFFALEAVGYEAMSISALFLALIFGQGKIESWIRWLFITNAVISTAAIIAYAFGNVILVFISLGVWAMVFPAATALIAVLFRRAYKATIIR